MDDSISKRAQDAILDNQLLDMVRLWLEPLPDRSLPSLDIQNELLDALDKVYSKGGWCWLYIWL